MGLRDLLVYPLCLALLAVLAERISARSAACALDAVQSSLAGLLAAGYEGLGQSTRVKELPWLAVPCGPECLLPALLGSPLAFCHPFCMW